MIWPLRRVLLVSHRPIDQAGGPAARWRSFSRHLPEHGWEVDVGLALAEGTSSPRRRRRSARAKVMETAGKVADPVFRLAGLRPEAMPLSMLWVRQGATGDPAPAGRWRLRRRARHRTSVRCVDRRPARGRRHAARRRAPRPLGGQPGLRPRRPGAAPARERGSRTARRRSSASRPRRSQTCRRGIPLPGSRRSRTASSPRCCAMRKPRGGGDDDPPLRDADEGPAAGAAPAGDRGRRCASCCTATWRRRFTPRSTRSGADVELVPPSGWEDAVRRIADADVALVTQARGAGDETAVAAKVYEYLALGKPVLSVTDGGATEALLRRLGADQLDRAARRPRVDRGRAREASRPETYRHPCRRRSSPRTSGRA